MHGDKYLKKNNTIEGYTYICRERIETKYGRGREAHYGQ